MYIHRCVCAYACRYVCMRGAIQAIHPTGAMLYSWSLNVLNILARFHNVDGPMAPAHLAQVFHRSIDTMRA